MAENKLEAVVVAIGTDIKNLRKAINDKETSEAIVAKLTELGQKIDAVTDVDYLSAYNQAKEEQ